MVESIEMVRQTYNKSKEKVRARMAPAPTGKLHIGTAHTALFNWLFTRHHKGEFILRIDDSDQKRSKKVYERDILESLAWLGINWDEGPYRQSESKKVYQRYAKKLLELNHAYFCYCSKEDLEKEREEQKKQGKIPHYSGKCRTLSKELAREYDQKGIKPAIRFKVPDRKVVFNDMVRGRIEVDMGQFGDFVIVRSDGSPLLNFAVVVDDIELKITHVIRGEDFINATPFQILIYEALGFDPPKIANLSFIYAPDRTKLSKRHGATGISEFRKLGYLAEAMVNYMALLGWNPGDEREIFSLEELIKEFDFDRVQKSAPIFDINKLDWFNGYYIRQKTDSELAELVKPYLKLKVDNKLLKKIMPLVKERIKKLSEFESLAGFFFKRPEVSKRMFGGNYQKHLRAAVGVLSKVEKWSDEGVNSVLAKVVKDKGYKTGDFFMDLRIAVCGSRVTPPINESVVLLGRDETIERLKEVLKKD